MLSPEWIQWSCPYDKQMLMLYSLIIEKKPSVLIINLILRDSAPYSVPCFWFVRPKLRKILQRLPELIPGIPENSAVWTIPCHLALSSKFPFKSATLLINHLITISTWASGHWWLQTLRLSFYSKDSLPLLVMERLYWKPVWSGVPGVDLLNGKLAT